MISLRAYRSVEDAWLAGVADWCRAATPAVLGGGRAWMVTASDCHTNGIKQRLLAEGVSLFGVQFLSVRSLRRELCLRAGWTAPALGVETLRFLLRVHALDSAATDAEGSAIARHPAACLAALDDLDAAGWLDGRALGTEVLPAILLDRLPQLRATQAWIPDVDRRLALHFATAPPAPNPLSICVLGWDAKAWNRFDLLLAAVRAATAASLYFPLPVGPAESLQQSWLGTCETAFGAERIDCEDRGFICAQAALAERLEGADLGGATTVLPAPELLTGVDSADTVLLVRAYVARWLSERAGSSSAETAGGERLAILCPSRNVTSVSLVRALTEANIAVEDELGELPQAPLTVQIQRAIVAYHLADGDVSSLLTLVELLNEFAAEKRPGAPVLLDAFPLDAMALRHALRGAFAEVQQPSVRLLSQAVPFARSPVAQAARLLIDHLGAWPELCTWSDARERWQQTLAGLGLTTEALEPVWSRVATLPIAKPIPSTAFLEYVGEILGGQRLHRDPAASHRFARVVLTTLVGAVGQTWGGLILLDANEGAWPIYPPENPFLGDTTRRTLNARRSEMDTRDKHPSHGHLLTVSDHADLEHSRFLEVLQNCHGPLAFASASRDSADPTRELYPNEWLLRCLLETGLPASPGADRLLDRWRRTVRRTARLRRPLAKSESAHLQAVWTSRRDPVAPFDEYFFNFIALTEPDELPWGSSWSAADLEKGWNRPASLALTEIFDAHPWHDDHRLTRGEAWIVGRLVHQWLPAALGAAREPRQVHDEDWTRALTHGLARARSETEESLRARLTFSARAPMSGHPTPTAFPLWWQGVLRKATWTTRRCLETLAETAAARGNAPVWLSLGQPLDAGLATAAGPLRVRARCDVALLDRAELTGAVGQFIDIRAKITSANAASTASLLAQGKGLPPIATLLAAVAAGAEPAESRAGTVHPDSCDLSLEATAVAPLASPILEYLARQQRTLVFGQKGPLVDPHNAGQAEELPLATTPVSVATLEAKARATDRALREP